MPLTGTFQRVLDEKFRLAVPKSLRKQFAQEEPTSLFIAPGTETSLALYSTAAFERLAERLAERSPNRAEVRNYLRLFYARAENVSVDGQGRIRIPERLVQFAQLKQQVVLLGVHDHAEIWDQELWEQFQKQHGSRFDELASGAFE